MNMYVLLKKRWLMLTNLTPHVLMYTCKDTIATHVLNTLILKNYVTILAILPFVYDLLDGHS